MSRIPGLIAVLGLSALIVVGCSAPVEGDPTATSTSTDTPKTEPPADSFVLNAKPIIDKSCLGCHSGKEPKGNIDMGKFKTGTDAAADLKTIHKMAEELEEKKMPPPNTVPLSDEDRAKLVAALKAVG